jgi:hypothetical protein
MGEGRPRDQRPREQERDDVCPSLRPVDRLAADDGGDRERNGREARDEESGREEQVAPARVDREADARQQRDQAAGKRDGGLEDEPEFRQLPVRRQALLRDEQRKRRPEEPEQQDLAAQPGLEVVSCFVPHTHSCRQIPPRR